MTEDKDFELNKPEEIAEEIIETEGESERKDAPVNGEDQAFKNGESLEDRVKLLSPGRLVAKRFFRSKLSVIGLVTLIAFFVISFLGPLLRFCCPFVWAQDEVDRTPGPYISLYTGKDYADEEGNKFTAYEYSKVRNNELNADAGPSATHLLGTDKNGYDIFSRIMYGGRVSLTLGFVVVILETLIGVILGGLAGFFGKWVDQLIMRIVDILNCIPTLPIMLIISFMLDANEIYGMSKLYITMAMLTLIGWAGTARMVRGQILFLREQEYMVATECTGLSIPKRIFKHLLPNVLPQLIVSMTIGLGGIILTEATLGYLGLGVPVEYATWVNMINVLTQPVTYWGAHFNQWIPVGICIILAVLAFNFVGDGLRDAFDPKMKR